MKSLRHLFVAAALLFATTALLAQKAELKVEVRPHEAFIFVDGQPYNHHDRKLELAPGEHVIGVYNYGFQPQVQKVVLKAGDNPELNVTLQPFGDPVKAPWGRLKIDGAHGRDAVFLNGTTPEFFVGHVDEANSHPLLSQKMILPPGIHQVTIVDPTNGRTVFSGPVEIVANRETYLDLDKKTTHFEPWHGSLNVTTYPRFSSTSGETIVAVAPVAGSFIADPAEINCNQPVQLRWMATDAVHGTLKANGMPLAETLNGEQMVSPKQTTTYEFQALGPGGLFTMKQTVRVNNTVQTSLTALPAELRYHQIGTRIETEDTANLKWTASNADSVRIDPLGPMSMNSGQTTLTSVPSNNGLGPIDEMRNYKITATNVCGGSDVSTASLHITGSIDPEPPAPVELPQTGSPIPLIGLLGFISLGSGMLLRKLRNR